LGTLGHQARHAALKNESLAVRPAHISVRYKHEIAADWPGIHQMGSKMLGGRLRQSLCSSVNKNIRASGRKSSSAYTAETRILHRTALDVTESTRKFLMLNLSWCFFSRQ